MSLRRLLLVTLALASLSACSDDDRATGTGPSITSAGSGNEATSYVPQVVDAVATADGDDTYRFDVTISSPYDSPERYADAWRAISPDGTELGVRELTHDHADEQPFTRSLTDVTVPAELDTVEIEARDLIGGWTGETYEVTIDR
jgi:hypothetical protein